MAVSVDQAGRDGATAKIDDAGVFGSESEDFFVATDGGDFAVVNGERRDDGIFGIDGDDFAVDEGDVGGVGAGGGRGLCYGGIKRKEPEHKRANGNCSHSKRRIGGTGHLFTFELAGSLSNDWVEPTGKERSDQR